MKLEKTIEEMNLSSKLVEKMHENNFNIINNNNFKKSRSRSCFLLRKIPRSTQENTNYTLFSTHYHELTELEGKMNNVNNYCIAVREQGDDIIFLGKF